MRRIEVITGVGGRRRWSLDDKARIIAATLEPGANVSDIARRHGLRPQQIFTWRRQARRLSSVGDEMTFMPVVVDQVPTLPSPRSRRGTTSSASSATVPAPIELKIGRAVLRVREGADPRALAAVVRALKRNR
ncbi:IS66-like element accessory protein TnpA [Marinivivus vitaminiproducens]|uniref:IS66-like element accessory protein TnpA n=1 Tax=Marinivivus vitaminiproducens TaxID=3035935 RepID=UPI00279F7A54|nr:transposase [Geminicoccaceae bacterium SCSIO 64248]